MVDATLRNVDLTRSSWEDISLQRAQFTDVDLRDVRITDAAIDGLVLEGLRIDDLIRWAAEKGYPGASAVVKGLGKKKGGE